ncbi:MAG: hypothetical protein JXB29_08945 [Sedimentisphaerales bacterium]|nr:hypothetical protein [Sedimentisphaerales bacterium]
MVRAKSTRIKKSKVLLGFGTSKKTSRRRKTSKTLSFKGLFKIIIAACVLGGLAVGFAFLERYIKMSGPAVKKEYVLELVDKPQWVSEALESEVRTSAITGIDGTEAADGIARLIQSNIEELVPWLDEVKVQTMSDSILIHARWRKPLALVSFGLKKFYLDSELVVLDYVPLLKLPTVKLRGLPVPAKMPAKGQLWPRDEAAAAVAVLKSLERMDQFVTPSKPLLYEIESIDISNFNGRQNGHLPHIILYTKDNTEIIWGAEVGSWQQHLEASDQDKLAKLYSYYGEYGSLLGGVKYINLRDPQETISQPIDKY